MIYRKKAIDSNLFAETGLLEKYEIALGNLHSK